MANANQKIGIGLLIALSVVSVIFAFWWKAQKDAQALAREEAAAAQEAAQAVEREAAALELIAPEPTLEAEDLLPPEPPAWEKPEELLSQIAEKVEEGKVEEVLEQIPAEAKAVREEVKKLIEEGYTVAEPAVEVGEQEGVKRYAITLAPPKDSEKKPVQLNFDFQREGRDSWELEGVAIASEGTEDQFSADALSAASAFLQLLVERRYAEALRYVDPEGVSEARLAALLIVFEEGEWQLQEKKPLVVTASERDQAWVVARLQSSQGREKSELGLEMKKAQEWKISAINLSTLLSAKVGQQDTEGIPYTPLVKNPQGGEALVIFFGFDIAEIHPRGLRQLELVSAILKSDAAKQIRIGGHADAKGSDSYNERLSASRAAAVRAALIKFGVAENQIRTSAFGEKSPLAPNVTEEGEDNPLGRAKNRRAEILLKF